MTGRNQPQRRPVAVRVAWDLHRVHRRSSWSIDHHQHHCHQSRQYGPKKRSFRMRFLLWACPSTCFYQDTELNPECRYSRKSFAQKREPHPILYPYHNLSLFGSFIVIEYILSVKIVEDSIIKPANFNYNAANDIRRYRSILNYYKNFWRSKIKNKH